MLNINFALYILQTIFQNIDYAPLKETLLLIIFGEFIDKRIQNLVRQNIDLPRSYYYAWCWKNCWDEVPEFINKKYGKLFCKNDYSTFLEEEKKEEENQPEIIEEIILPEEPKKPASKYDFWMKKMGHFKTQFATTSTQIYSYLYPKKNFTDYEKEFQNIYKIIVSSMDLKDPETNIELSFPYLIKDTLKHLHGFNKELEKMREKVPQIPLNDENLVFKNNDFAEILKSFFQVFLLMKKID